MQIENDAKGKKAHSNKNKLYWVNKASYRNFLYYSFKVYFTDLDIKFYIF